MKKELPNSMKHMVHPNITQCQFDWATLNLQPVPEQASISIEITSLPETQEGWWSELKYKRIPQKPGIYAIVNILNGHFYVGSAVNLCRRRSEHFTDLQKNKHHSGHLQNAYIKYGADAFRFFIVEYVEVAEDLLKREQYYIDTLNPEYNINPIAGSALGIKRSEETKVRMRESAKNRKRGPLSEQHKKNLSKARKGKPQSAAHKAKNSESHKGHTPTEATRKKLSESHKGHKHTEASKAKLSEAGKGRKHTEASKAKMSEALKGKPSPHRGKPKSPASIAKRTATRKAKREADPTYGTKKRENSKLVS
jgi:group I intron endonuclease